MFTCKFSYFGGIPWLKISILAPTLVPSLPVPTARTSPRCGTGKLDQNGNRIALDVKVGDQVFYGKFGGTEVKVDGEELLLLRADDILAVLED